MVILSFAKQTFTTAVVLLLLFLFSSLTNANTATLPQQLTTEPGHWYLGGYAGIAFPKTTGQHTLAYVGTQQAAGIFNTTGTNNTPRLGLVGGYTLSWHRHWFPRYRFGAELWRIGDTQAKGKWTDESFGAPFQQYNYRYSVGVTSVGLTAEFDIIHWHNFSPFMGVGVGNAWISSTDFHALPVSGVSRDIGFSDKTQRHIYYEGKIGVGYQLNKHTTLRAWYSYDDLGKITIGRGGYPTALVKIPSFSDKLRIQSVALSFIHTF